MNNDKQEKRGGKAKIRKAEQSATGLRKAIWYKLGERMRAADRLVSDFSMEMRYIYNAIRWMSMSLFIGALVMGYSGPPAGNLQIRADESPLPVASMPPRGFTCSEITV